jgi:beta-glucosidase
MANPFQRALSANIDDRALHELYLWPFAEAVKVGVGAAMTSYNDVNGSQANQNSYLVNGILKDELGFQGFTMSDWFSQQSGVSSALSGLDLAMPGDGTVPVLGTTYWNSELSKSILNGTIPLPRLNDMVTRIVAAWFQLGQDNDYPLPNFSSWTSDTNGPYYPGALIGPSGVVNEHVDVQANHKEIVRNVARDAITLLKNTNNTLPLSNNASLYVFGTDQAKNPDGINSCGSRACNKGTLAMGWGSGVANFPYLDDPITAIKAVATSVKTYNTDTFPSTGINAGANDIALVFITSDSGENSFTVEGNPGDRTASGLKAWHKGDDLVKAAAEKFSKVIVIVHTVGPILMEEWADLPSVASILVAHLPGQEAGGSLTDVLFGEYSPSGHLPYSIAKSEDDYPDSLDLIAPAITLSQVQDTFAEGLYIDYRYLQAHNITPRYAFGHGLSYTTFSFSNTSLSQLVPLTVTPGARPSKLATPSYSAAIPPAAEVAWPKGFKRISRYLYPYLDNPESIKVNATKYPYPEGYRQSPPQPPPVSGGGEGGHPDLFVEHFRLTTTVANTGDRPGRAVAQLYVKFPVDAGAPPLQLREFSKTAILQPGGNEEVSMVLRRKDLSIWDVTTQQWTVPGAGDGSGIEVWVGWSSDDVKVGCTIGGGCENA